MKEKPLFRSKKNDLLYFMISTDTNIRLFLEEMIEQNESKTLNKKDTVEKCIGAVAYYENNKNLLTDRENDKIIRDEELNSYTVERVDSSECAFKLKCIVAMKEYLDGDCKSISEAAYATCADENVCHVATALDKGKNAQKKTGNIIFVTSAIFALSGPFLGIFALPMELLASLGMLSEKRISSKLGIASSKYTLYKIKKLKERKEDDYDYKNTDFSQEYFDPTYVNMYDMGLFSLLIQI